MATTEERMEILKMIQAGKISAAEGARLLEALDESREQTSAVAPEASPTPSSRRVRILITDLSTGRQKVNVELPWNLINVGMHMGARFTPEDIDLEEVMESLQSGAEGKVVDVEDHEDNERIEVFVE